MVRKIRDMYNNGFYLGNYQDWHLSDSEWKANKIVNIFDENSVSPESICEIGCGAGGILLSLNEKMNGMCNEFTGYEISTDAYQICSKKSNDNVKFIFDNGMNSSNKSHDVALIIDVIEHVEDCLKFLREIRESGLYSNYVFHIPLDLSVLSVLRGSPIIELSRLLDLNKFDFIDDKVIDDELSFNNTTFIKKDYNFLVEDYDLIILNYATLTDELLSKIYQCKAIFDLNNSLEHKSNITKIT